MSAHNNYSRISTFAILLLLNHSWLCMSLEKSSGAAQGLSQHPAPGSVFNISYAANALAVATWYGPPNGAGDNGGACGYQEDVGNFPYNGLVTAGNNNLYRSGKGCGNCFSVSCTENPACSGRPITVVITDECPGACNNEAFHFDLSGKAFGALAKNGQGDALRKAGRINIQYQRAKCAYRASITFKIDAGSNKYSLAFVPENVNGDGEIGSIQIQGSNRGATWLNMQQTWGATWRVSLPEGTAGPFSVRLTASRSTITASNVIPFGWTPRARYPSKVNFPVN